MQTALTFNSSIQEWLAKVHDEVEGRYVLTSEDLFDIQSVLMQHQQATVEQSDEKAAWNHYWENNPDAIIAENSRPKEVIAYIAGCQHIRQQQQQKEELLKDMAATL